MRVVVRCPMCAPAQPVVLIMSQHANIHSRSFVACAAVETVLQIMFSTEINMSGKGILVLNKKVPAASLKRRKCGVGLPIHIEMLLILVNILY